MNTDIRIALLGYGHMGQELHTIIRERGWSEPLLIDPQHSGAYASIEEAPLDQADVCVDFTEPAQAFDTVLFALRKGMPVVSGTTGWQPQDAVVLKAIEDNNAAFLHANNFALGVYLFALMVKHAAALLSSFPQYDIAIHETHHRAKKDIPSGTAQMLAEEIISAHPGKETSAVLSESGAVDNRTLTISSARIGSVFGTHNVCADSEVDSIELTHTDKGRRGLAEGALTAAQWLVGKQGFFTLEDMIDDITTA